VTYNDTSHNPNTTSRTISFVANDGTLNSVASTKTVSLTAVDTPPVVTAGNTISVGKNTTTIISSSASVTDADNANFNGGSLTVSITGDSSATTLSIRNQGTSSGQIGTSGSNVTFGGVSIGTFTGGGSGSNLVVNFNTAATPTAVTALLDNIQFRSGPSTAQQRTVTFAVNDGSGSIGLASATINFTNPAGVAGNPIQLALVNPSEGSPITINIAGVPSGWTFSSGTNGLSGVWTITTNDPSALNVATPDNFTGASVLQINESWTNANGSTSYAFIADNVEAYASGSPIFAVSGDDTLTGSAAADDFVFAQPIGNDTIYNFNVASDQINLIAFNDVTSFLAIQNGLTNDANGNAVIALAAGETITLKGVDASSLNASNFIFDQTPVTENPGGMAIGDGAVLPLSGTVDNTGTIALNSSGNETTLQLIQQGITLQGGGQVTLSDNSENVITGTSSDVALTNVDNIIAGAGQLGQGQMTLVNEGTIDATGTNALVVDTGNNLIDNSGRLEATGGGGLTVNSAVDNSGNLWANGGNITINGAVTGNGTATISGAATLEFGAASAENTSFAAGATGTLKLDQSSNFTGTLTGFGAGDSIDLTDVASGANTTIGFAANADGSGGTLTVSDGTHTAGIALFGQYSAAGFQVGADQNNGALVTYAPPDAAQNAGALISIPNQKA
jgi:hypothetical protein